MIQPVIMPRAAGKTTALINLADGRNGYIVCHSRKEAMRIQAQATQQGKDIHLPLTYRDIRSCEQYRHEIPLYIDNIDMFLAYYGNVQCFSLSPQ